MTTFMQGRVWSPNARSVGCLSSACAQAANIQTRPSAANRSAAAHGALGVPATDGFRLLVDPSASSGDNKHTSNSAAQNKACLRNKDSLDGAIDLNGCNTTGTPTGGSLNRSGNLVVLRIQGGIRVGL